MKEFYAHTEFRPDSLALIGTIDGIMHEYVEQGYMLTVRQLYYQLVARDIIPNTERSYKNTVSLVNNARLAGLLDWDAIEDRTRRFQKRARWRSGSEIIKACAVQYHMDMWEGQPRRVFCIVEKEALAGVLERVCTKFDVPLLAARGYPSASVLREFAKDELSSTAGQDILILHLGDHDPSGIDMTRDLEERLMLLSRQRSFELRRIALTMRQIDEEDPPPNPAKTTDARFQSYVVRYGSESWELDALRPQYLANLVTRHITEAIDTGPWNEREAEIDSVRTRIRELAELF
jgi:hypothetical protein